VQPAIGQVDAAILVAYLLGVVALGIWLGRGQRDLADYLLAGRNLAWWTVLLSIVATETSTVTFLSVPGISYDPRHGDLLFLQLTVGFILGRFLVVLLLLPHYFRGEMFTAYQVLHGRFGGATKQTASLLFLASRNLSDGLRLYLTAIVLERLLGIDLAVSIVVIGAATIVYTLLGGMRSVVWNDCVQFVVYMAGALVAGWVLVDAVPDGWRQIADFARDRGKLELFDFGLDFRRPYTFWSGLVGGTFLAMATHGTDQMMVQRYLAAGSRRKAAFALGASGFVIAAQFAVFLLVGIGLASYYHLHPAEATFQKNDEAFAAFIVDHMPMGAKGLTLAAVFAAAMSTLSSSLNSSAAAAVSDFYRPAVERIRNLPGQGGKSLRERSPRHFLRVSRVLTLAFGLLQIGVALAGRHLARSVVDSVLAIASFTTGAVLGVFLLGVLTRWVSQSAALAGLVGGLAVMSVVALATPVAWPWYAVIGSTATFLIGASAEILRRVVFTA